MNLKQRANDVKNRISILSGVMKPLQYKMNVLRLLLIALYDTCKHEYEIVKGDEKAGVMLCIICGESHEFFTLDPVYIATIGKNIPFIKTDLKRWNEKAVLIKTMAVSVLASDSELKLISDYVDSQISKCQEQLKEIESNGN